MGMMRKMMVAVLTLVCVLVGAVQEKALAEPKTAKQYYEEFYTAENGYMPVEKAVGIFERINGKEVELPTKFPFKMIMQTAQLVSSPDGKGTALKVYYLAEQPSDTMIVLICDNYPMEMPRVIDEFVGLEDGTLAVLKNHHHFYFLDFEKRNGVRYIFGIAKTSKIKIFAEVMKEIADSMTD